MQHSTGAPTCHDFPRFVIISEKSRLEVGNRWRWSRFFGKRPLKGKFSKKNVSERIHCLSESCFLCKFRETWLTGNRQSRELFTWQINFRKDSGSRFCAVRGQNRSGPAPNNILGASQISSKSAHFRRSYSRTREHRWNAPQSLSNTRLLRRVRSGQSKEGRVVAAHVPLNRTRQVALICTPSSTSQSASPPYRTGSVHCWVAVSISTADMSGQAICHLGFRKKYF